MMLLWWTVGILLYVLLLVGAILFGYELEKLSPNDDDWEE